MKFQIELEEWVGGYWHRFITRHASADFPEAGVSLEQMGKTPALLFRALGGAPGMSVEGATARSMVLRRNWLQKIAGTCEQLPVAWRNADSLRLPENLAVYPDRELNRELYRWLALLAAVAGPMRHWARDNQAWTQWLLHYPPLMMRYRCMVEALLPLRPDPADLPPAEAAMERALQQALQHPGSVRDFPRSDRAPWPVPLWLYPEDLQAAPQQTHWGEETHTGSAAKKPQRKLTRKRAQRVADRNGRNGLLLFRLESLFSWSEHLDLDRCGDDEDDQDASRVADDLEYLTLSHQRSQKGGGLKLDLDLPAAALDDLPLGPGEKLPEWDYRQQVLRQEHVLLQPMLPRDAMPSVLPEPLRLTARRMRRQFECLRSGNMRMRQQPQGNEPDLEAWLDFQVERRNRCAAERGFFIEQIPQRRSLACLLLADLSMSTDAYLDNQRRVIDAIIDSLLLFGEALDALGDPFALYGFSSLRRHQVRLQILKPFEQAYGDKVRGRILALRPGYYTRMGAAIRKASQLLEGMPQKRRLLLLISDGKPNDLDIYEGRYGVEDTRQAVLEARQRNLLPFCITIDQEAKDYLSYMFGSSGYVVIGQPQQLPTRLLHLYKQLRR